eukprot:CAMPEP_0177598730 /NCGR_PEP_ID=MMETSP0419_2-20121207/12543_1 /TAXON_ID=582737 /ORGANISM="Tetraselmis sp., Strain GSL018" /LENGTH=412 /DNA_ID=CAMNT_0019091271 /DNA_START=204 /DNA_END=1442 /DNA_ORIENTATION=+
MTVFDVSCARRGAEARVTAQRPPYDNGALLGSARALDPELVQAASPPGRRFIPGLRSPCWEDGSGSTKCLPAFYILGSFQAGTWNLYSRLAVHPDVVSVPNARPHFWAEHDKRAAAYVAGYSAPPVLEVVRRNRNALLGDASASTFAFYWAASQRLHGAFREAMAPCWEACAKGPRASLTRCVDSSCFPAAMRADEEAAAAANVSHRFAQLPLLMRAVYGARPPRLVAILRDPVERFHHAFWAHPHYRDRYGATAEGFLSFTREQVSEFRACEEQHGPARCALYFEAHGHRQEGVFFHCDQLIRGMYSIFVEGWTAFFGDEAFLAVEAEAYYSSPREVLAEVMNHLGLRLPTNEEWEAIISAGSKGRAHLMEGKPDMLPEARGLLTDLYAPWNRRLAALTGNRRFLWGGGWR